MPYDVELAERVRALVGTERRLTEKKMFGGLAFLIGGHMSVTASREGGLLVRVDPAETDELAGQPGASRFEMGKRELTGWLRIAPEAVRSDAELRAWVQRSVTYARSLPPKG